MEEMEMATPQQFIRQALDGDPAWVFHHCMTKEDRDDFDRWLVEIGDRLAFEAGTQESRFRDYVRLIPPALRLLWDGDAN